MIQGRRERNKAQCRSRILRMSRRLFTAKGYENTTIEDIAEAAEISKATLYNYFASKEQLLLGIAEAALEEIRQLIREDLAEEPSSLEKLRRVMETLVLDSVRYLALTRRIFSLNASPGSALYGPRQELLEILGRLAGEAQARGQLRQEVPTGELVEVLLSVYLLALFGWEDADRCSLEECRQKVRRVLDLTLTGLGEPADGGKIPGGICRRP